MYIYIYIYPDTAVLNRIIATMIKNKAAPMYGLDIALLSS